MLRVTINDTEEGFFYFDKPIQIEPLPKDTVWLETINRCLSHSFEYGGHLSKLFLIQKDNESYIIFVAHHILSDAATAIEFIKDILNYYYCNSSELLIENDLFPNFIDSYPKKHLFPNNIIKERIKTKAQTITLSAQDFSLALAKAKLNNVYFNTLITYFLLQISSDIFGFQKFSIITPVNLRKHRDLTSDRRLAFFSSNIAFDFEKTSNIKELLFEIKRQFVDRKSIRNIDLIKHELEHAQSANDFCKNFISQTPAFGISANTIGKSAISSVIDELFVFVNTQQYFSCPGSFTAQYALANSKLCISLNYPDNLIQEETALLITKKLKKALSCL